ncbi:MAG: sigma-54-dependent Fis family transcriptional regulator, partial [Mesorhizobium sp.]
AKGLLAADVLGDAPGAREDLDDAERGVLQRALARAGGNVSAAAQSLGISRATLHRKLARFAIRRPH